MPKGIIQVDKQLIGEMLQLPQGFNLVGVQMDFNERTVDFKYESDLIPGVADNAPFPSIAPVLYEETKHVPGNEVSLEPKVLRRVYLKKIMAWGEFEKGKPESRVIFGEE
jgi:hypothetical protein